MPVYLPDSGLLAGRVFPPSFPSRAGRRSTPSVSSSRSSLASIFSSRKARATSHSGQVRLVDAPGGYRQVVSREAWAREREPPQIFASRRFGLQDRVHPDLRRERRAVRSRRATGSGAWYATRVRGRSSHRRWIPRAVHRGVALDRGRLGLQPEIRPHVRASVSGDVHGSARTEHQRLAEECVRRPDFGLPLRSAGDEGAHAAGYGRFSLASQVWGEQPAQAVRAHGRPAATEAGAGAAEQGSDAFATVEANVRRTCRAGKVVRTLPRMWAPRRVFSSGSVRVLPRAALKPVSL